jgi:hypothetical protein
MTRNWFVVASSAPRTVRTRSNRPRQNCTTVSLEALEHRLSLSAYSGGVVSPADLNPQPLPPGYAHVEPMAVTDYHHRLD